MLPPLRCWTTPDVELQERFLFLANTLSIRVTSLSTVMAASLSIIDPSARQQSHTAFKEEKKTFPPLDRLRKSGKKMVPFPLNSDLISDQPWMGPFFNRKRKREKKNERKKEKERERERERANSALTTRKNDIHPLKKSNVCRWLNEEKDREEVSASGQRALSFH